MKGVIMEEMTMKKYGEENRRNISRTNPFYVEIVHQHEVVFHVFLCHGASHKYLVNGDLSTADDSYLEGYTLSLF